MIGSMAQTFFSNEGGGLPDAISGTSSDDKFSFNRKSIIFVVDFAFMICIGKGLFSTLPC